MATSFQVTFDCLDPDRLATFWAAALGYKKQDPPEGFASWHDFLVAQGVPEDQWNAASAVVDPDGQGPRIFFQRVPEEKRTKNRLHLDVAVTGGPNSPLEDRKRLVQAARERLVGLGARPSRTVEHHGEYWAVLQDPEGNEFCLQ